MYDHSEFVYKLSGIITQATEFKYFFQVLRHDLLSNMV